MQTQNQSSASSSVHKNSTPQSKLLEMKRQFDVPVEQLFKAFTNSDSIKAWWWPKGLFTDHAEYDFREGGQYFINLKGREESSGGMTGQFDEIIENKLIVMTDRFSDKDGNPISAKEAKMAGVWPEKVYMTFEFESLGEDRSVLNFSQQGIPNEMQKDCLQGWSEMFDKLEKLLKNQKN